MRFVAEPVRAVLDDGERVTGVRTEAGERPAERVLVAAGAHSAGLHPALHGLVRPVKGEILRLAHRAGAFPPPSRTVRALVDGRPVYAVPRDGGGLVVGATQDEPGFDTEVTVGGVRDLLRDAERVLPGIAEYALVESAAGLRPGSPDNLPLIGAPGPDGLLVATGHHRNGMLLAPITAEAVLALLAGDPVPEPVRAADPRRFGRPASRASNQQGGSRCRCGSTGSRASWPTAPGCRTRSTSWASRAPGSRSRWTARSCRGRRGRTPRWPTARGSRC